MWPCSAPTPQGQQRESRTSPERILPTLLLRLVPSQHRSAACTPAGCSAGQGWAAQPCCTPIILSSAQPPQGGCCCQAHEAGTGCSCCKTAARLQGAADKVQLQQGPCPDASSGSGVGGPGKESPRQKAAAEAEAMPDLQAKGRLSVAFSCSSHTERLQSFPLSTW